MKNWFLTTLLLFSLAIIPAQAQDGGFFSRYLNKFLNDTTPVSKPRFLIYPTVVYSPETSWEFGLSSLYVYYAKEDTANRQSEIRGFTFFTLEKQYGLLLNHTLYSDRDKWIFPGRFRFQSFPMLYYGIGPGSPSKHTAEVENVLVQVRERVMRRVYPNLYVGLDMDLQRLSSVSFNPSAAENLELPIGNKGSTNLAFGLGLMYDTRKNVLNVRQGIFSELVFLRYDDTWGSDFSWSSLISDSRFYKQLNKRNVLATQVLGQFNFGEIPFNQLALLGGENINRGYYLGRFRDKNQLAAQIEYRMLPFSFAKRWGGTVFMSTGTVFDEFSHLSADNLVFSGGAGLRFLLFPKKDIYTRLDVAFTKEKPGIYILIGEAF